MLKNYFLVAVRNLYRNRLYAAVNIVGLGVAMALCVVGYVNYQFSGSFDAWHEHADRIFTVAVHRLDNQGNRQNWSTVPTPLAPAIEKDIPGIEKASRLAQMFGTMRYEDKIFNEAISFVDVDFFDMFTFPMIQGASDALKDRTGIVITDEIAEKYFGQQNPVGQQVVISSDGEQEFGFVVRGVIAKPPKNSSLVLDICIVYEREQDLQGFDHLSWGDWTRTVLIQIEDDAVPAAIEEKLQDYVVLGNEANPDFTFDGYYLTPLRQLAYTTRDLFNDPFMDGMHPAAIVAPSIAALLVLLLACFNFVNTSIAFAGKRLKEIGIRKVIGGMRRQLIRQFLGENLLLCFVALLIAAGLAEIFVPAYDSLWPELSLTMDYSANPGLIGFFVVLLLFTGLAAGAYPALYVSRFNPVSIFRGRQKLGGTNPLIRVLLTFQLALSMVSIIAALILTRNADYINTLDLGYDADQVLVVRINGEDQYKLLKNTVADHAGIISAGGTRSLMGRFLINAYADIDQKQTLVSLFDIGEDYFETIGFQLIEGRTLNAELMTDIDEAIIVNETLIKQFGWESPLDKQIALHVGDSLVDYRVVGVCRDFYPNGVDSRLLPAILRLTPYDRYGFLSIKCADENSAAVATYVEETWKRLFPHRPYSGFWQEETLAVTLQINEGIKLVFLYIAIMVLIISSMGLFALVSLNIARRTKEIGIRKVLGASVPNIGYLIAREFVVLIVLGSILASAMGYFLLDSFLSSIWIYYCDFGVTPFIFAVILVVGVALFTVGLQVLRVASANPVNALRHE